MIVAVVAALVAGCGLGGTASSTPQSTFRPASTTPSAPEPTAEDALGKRLQGINEAVDRWRGAADLASAKSAAEEARNLVVGPAGPGFGDVDGDGSIEGASTIGLLPGRADEPGLATVGAGLCVERDILGGSWADPVERWAILGAAIDAWTPSNNTFPSLPSHPQRIVGWATLTQAASDLENALEYGGHAHLHIAISMSAAASCSG